MAGAQAGGGALEMQRELCMGKNVPKALWVWKGLLNSLNLVSIDADTPVWITQTKDAHTPACTSPVTTVIV